MPPAAGKRFVRQEKVWKGGIEVLVEFVLLSEDFKLLLKKISECLA